MTINEAMVLVKAIRERMGDLKQIRSTTANRQSTYYRDRNEEIKVEPQYDVKAVDKKVTELQNFLFLTEAKIKQANAKTEIDLTVDVEKLLEPIQ